MCGGTTIDFIGTENITLDMDFFSACAHHKLNFEVHRSKTCNFVNRLATMLYSKYVFLWSGRVQFVTGNSRASFSKVEWTDMGKFLPYSWHNNIYCIISLMVKIFSF
jgi:hypothetical protein